MYIIFLIFLNVIICKFIFFIEFFYFLLGIENNNNEIKLKRNFFMNLNRCV